MLIFLRIHNTNLLVHKLPGDITLDLEQLPRIKLEEKLTRWTAEHKELNRQIDKPRSYPTNDLLQAAKNRRYTLKGWMERGNKQLKYLDEQSRRQNIPQETGVTFIAGTVVSRVK